MTDDAKEWVTIKVPKDARDAARGDPRTYGEVLLAGTGESLATTENARPDPDAVADAVVDALDMDDPGDRAGPDFDALAREVARQIDYAMLASKVADELEGRIR